MRESSKWKIPLEDNFATWLFLCFFGVVMIWLGKKEVRAFAKDKKAHLGKVTFLEMYLSCYFGIFYIIIGIVAVISGVCFMIRPLLGGEPLW